MAGALTRSVVLAGVIFLAGLFAFQVMSTRVAERDNVPVITVLRDLAGDIFGGPNPELDRPLEAYMPADVPGWDRSVMAAGDYLWLLTDEDRTSANADRKLRMITFNHRLRLPVVYEQTERVSLTYRRGDDVVMVNLLWVDADKLKGFAGGLTRSMRAADHPDLAKLQRFGVLSGLPFHAQPQYEPGVLRLHAQMNEQAYITVVARATPASIAEVLSGLDVAGLNRRLQRPIPGIADS